LVEWLGGEDSAFFSKPSLLKGKPSQGKEMGRKEMGLPQMAKQSDCQTIN
jgi:hypothetical protein